MKAPICGLSLTFVLALSLSSYASTNDPISQTPLSIDLDGASFGNFQLIDGQITVSVDPEEPQASSCFPGLGFKMPSSTPKSLDDWWCNATSEYAFLGFSYEISACKSPSDLNRHSYPSDQKQQQAKVSRSLPRISKTFATPSMVDMSASTEIVIRKVITITS